MQERLALAQDEYLRGLANLRSTAKDLRSLSSRVSGSEKAARGALRMLHAAGCLSIEALP